MIKNQQQKMQQVQPLNGEQQKKMTPAETSTSNANMTERNVNGNCTSNTHSNNKPLCVDVNTNADANTVAGAANIALSNKDFIKTPSPIASRPVSCETMELSETFYITSRRKGNLKIQVILKAQGIFLRRKTGEKEDIEEQLIRLEDIIGSRCGPRLKRTRGGLISCRRIGDEPDEASPSDANAADRKDTSAYLYIYAYIKNELGALRRHRTVRILRFRSYEKYEDNFKTAERWQYAIRVNKGAQQQGMERRQLLILLNPKSGKGKGRTMFQKQVVPVLREAEMQYDLQVTTHPNYARELMRERKNLLQCYSGIVVASGDGLLNEVLNGLMERPDWHVAMRKLPLGIIPCGSGNGLAKSIAHLHNEPYEPKPILYATLTCISGKTAPMDIVRVHVGHGENHTQMYSFLSVGWGLIADVDIESERLRAMGAPRFTLWTIHRLISLRTYKGKLSYLPVKEENSAHIGTLERYRRIDPEKPNDSNETGEPTFEDAEEVDEDYFDAISIDRQSRLPHVGSWHSAISRRTAYYSVAGQSMRSYRSITPSVMEQIEAANAQFETQGPATTLPPLNMPLPEETWHTEDGNYVMVHSAYTTHLSSDCFFAPDSRLNDGIIYLVIIRAGVSRPELLQFLVGMSAGTHLPIVPNDNIQVVKVRAFRIEPEPSKEGIMTVDGERVTYGPIQAEILPGMIKVMVPNSGSRN